MALEPLECRAAPEVRGHQAHALFLRLLGTSAPALTKNFHKQEGLKPYTVSFISNRGRLREAFSLPAPDDRFDCYLRLTFLKSDILPYFLDGMMKWGDRPVELGSALFHIKESITKSKTTSLTPMQSYQCILDNAQGERHIQLEFLTPTVFRSAGRRNMVFPQPELVFGSYLSKWNSYSHIKLDKALKDIFSQHMIPARYKLQTRMLDFGSYQEVGFVGRCTFLVSDSVSKEALIQINALADFAFYAGTGAKTTMGMGQTRRVVNFENGRKEPDKMLP
jgi:CRISPR-associated endoribonuclease Cas6